MQTTHVGIREAKVHLSKFIKIVKNGGEVVITERGRPVGKIVPYRTTDLPIGERLKKLEEEGVVAPALRTSGMKIHPPIPLAGEVAQKYLAEDRDRG